ncbi:uncharacterized protein FOMMEDRAFT_156655 [Fomitiporia mediterranea MF3/22]|uniref:uncharacterized protein n=1 Tax=Fomitiporia mediterranea (strain MF3/22) TaxID=694068 RepID=UPI0004407527|nr:uncharacterized protein FOMMEDRAFT_156655 [Fomitiporia mediterranea MF3/22]EJD03269.1 hypothetical protein FOMMEDRAFT_156655 [Fomitiporia mediterranea MF3/22]
MLGVAELTESLIECAKDANATRYVNGVGLVIVLYDHMITFHDEVRLIWQARSSFAKWLFLCNRYMVPTTLIWVAIFMNNFTDNVLGSDNNCRRFFAISSVFGVLSVAIANVLVLLRVVNLWERSRMLFEVIVLLAVCLNAFDRPHIQNCEVKRGLIRDGIGFFAALTALRLFNLLLTSVVKPSLTVLGVFFVWAMTTVVLNRALFSILRTTVDARSWDTELSLPISTMNIRSTSPYSPIQLYPSRDKISMTEAYELR